MTSAAGGGKMCTLRENHVIDYIQWGIDYVPSSEII